MLYFQPNQQATDNFSPIDLSWLHQNPDVDTFQGHGQAFLEDPLKINDDNREMWCNLHVTPVLSSVLMEICSLEEVAYWAKKKHLGSDSHLTETGMANLVVTTGSFPWPCTLSLARVVVAPGQKLCSLTEAMDLVRECFDKPKGLEEAYYYLTLGTLKSPTSCLMSGSKYWMRIQHL